MKKKSSKSALNTTGSEITVVLMKPESFALIPSGNINALKLPLVDKILLLLFCKFSLTQKMCFVICAIMLGCGKLAYSK